jgi:hypothetical protein
VITLDDDILAQDRAAVQMNVDTAAGHARAAAVAERERLLTKQLAEKLDRQREYPVGQKAIRTFRPGIVDFVKILSYSQRGKSLRVCAFVKTAIDVWIQKWPGHRGDTIKRTVTLYRADWAKETGACYSIGSNQLGISLMKGCNRPIQFDANTLPKVGELDHDSKTPVVNVRSTAGKLWHCINVTPELTASELRCSVANAIQLLPTRGTVILCHGTTLLEGPEKIISSCVAEGPLELTAVVEENQSWAIATDGRAMPYGIEYCVCSEDLAFGWVIEYD